MSETLKIEYHKTRDFGKKINATIEFIKQNFKPLFKAMLFIAGPPIILGSILMAQILDNFMNILTYSTQGLDPELDELMGLIGPAIGAVIFLVIGGTAIVAVVYDYVILYEKQGKDITVQEVWERAKKSFWRVLGTMLLYVIVLMVAYLIMLIPTFLLAVISPALTFIGILVFYAGAIYVVVTFSLIFIVMAYEQVNFATAISRCFQLIKSKWWSTFGLFIVTSLIQSVISSIFFIPWYVIFIISMLHNTDANTFGEPGAIAQVIGTICLLFYLVISYLLYCIPLTAIAFQYFNLVELKESKGLMAKIETFGAASTPQDEEEHY